MIAGGLPRVSVLALLVGAACAAASGEARGDRADSQTTLQSSGLIAFVRLQSGAIHAMKSNGTGLRRLTPSRLRRDIEAGKWSPDGTRLAFVGRDPTAGDAPDSRDELYVIRVDGTHLVRLTRNKVADDQPSWSPDSKRIVYTSHLPSGTELYTVNAAGRGVRRLTQIDGFDQGPAWSPDGSRIAFTYSKFPDERADIWTIAPSGGSRERLTQADSGEDGFPVWSPDGTRVLFARGTYGDPTTVASGIYVVNADASGLRRLTRKADVGELSWFPNGRWIAFLGEQGLYRMKANGSDMHRLAADAVEYSVSPDSRKIAFTRNEDNDIYVVNADGSRRQRLTRLRGGGYDPAISPAWQPAP